MREQRKRAGLSQEKLAEKADLHPNYMGRVERGEEHVSLAALRRIARALKVRVAELVKDI
jgi:transcriptional regulator with XRE-family HTH domain